MFSVERRSRLLTALVEAARVDDSVIGAALIGSMARRESDRWSDIDLALGLAPGADAAEVVVRWSALVHELGPVADHLDIETGDALYRVFLLRDSLQIDLSFWRAGSFGSNGEAFDVLFGAARPQAEPSPMDVRVVVGWGWLYALHARAALQRERTWQGLQMVDGLRDQLIALACLRHGLPAFQGRGVDRLPDSERADLLAAVASGPETRSLQDALTAGLRLLALEARRVDDQWANRLIPALEQLQQP